MPIETEHSKLTPLRLVYPPVSNQEAEWLCKDPAVQDRWRKSDFYMIAARAEAFFDDIVISDEGNVISLSFRVGQNRGSKCTLQVRELDGVRGHDEAALIIEAGEKHIRIRREDPEVEGEEPLTWFTTERLLHDRGRGRPGIVGLNDFLELSTYDLLYVGIAKKGDTYDRLFANAHKARQSILSNEPQRYPGARVTDEIYLFLFEAKPFFFSSFATVDEFAGAVSGKAPVDQKQIVADAEKAYVSLLQPDYNHVKFKTYPKGVDGLYGSKLKRYAYQIGANLSFRTAHGSLKGGWNHVHDIPSNGSDLLAVEGENVLFFRSGVDFPADDPAWALKP